MCLSGEGRAVHLIPPAHTCPQAKTSLPAQWLGPRSAPGSCTRREASPLIASLPRCASPSDSNYSREGETLPPNSPPGWANALLSLAFILKGKPGGDDAPVLPATRLEAAKIRALKKAQIP